MPDRMRRDFPVPPPSRREGTNWYFMRRSRLLLQSLTRTLLLVTLRMASYTSASVT